MSKGRKQDKARQLQRLAEGQAARNPAKIIMQATPAPSQFVPSLYDVLGDQAEYAVIIDKLLAPGIDFVDDLVRALRNIENIRKRPCIAYVGNVVRKEGSESGVDSSDDLPFREMIARIPANERSVDVYLATLGGSAHQVNNFVNSLRPRFDDVQFLIPSFCMSAGTLFALSGNEIWMTDRASLGPIDPQVPTSQGRYVPAQALLLLVAEIQRQGADALSKGQPVPWSLVRIIDTLDKKELAEAFTASQYSETMATEFLNRYKLVSWIERETSRTPVTADDRLARAREIAGALVSHDHWKSHGHSISRDVLWNDIKLRIRHPDPDLNLAMNKLWALLVYAFDKTPIVKTIFSGNYRYLRHVTTQIIGVKQ